MKQPNPSDKHYETALDEILFKRLDKAIFARAIQDAHGKEEETKALYIRYRSHQLAEIDQLEQARVKRELEEDAKREAHARLEQEKDFYRRYPVMTSVSAEIQQDFYKRHTAGEDISLHVSKFERIDKTITYLLVGILVILGAVALIFN